VLPTSTSSNQERSERFNKALGVFQKFIQRRKERLWLDSPEFSNRWLARTLVLAIGVINKNSGKMGWLVCLGSEHPNEIPANKILIPDAVQLSVFVHDIEMVNLPQPSRFRAFLVGSDFICYEILSLGTHACYFSGLNGFKLFESFGYRKSTRLRGFDSVCLDETPSQMVQSGSHVVDGIPGSAQNFNIQQAVFLRSLKFTLRIYKERYVARCFERFSGESLDIYDVLMGPVGLRSDSVQPPE
jgi:hypothetical protein